MLSAVPLWIALSAAGLLLLLLPEHGPRLFSLSDEHGPSAIDLAGIALLIAAWAIPAIVIWRKRHELWDLGAPARFVVLIAVLSLTLLTVSVFGDLGSWWLVGAVLLALIQILAFTMATR